MQPEEYLKLAEVEDHLWYFHALHAHIRRELVRAGFGGRAADMLDAGCGTGGQILRLREQQPLWRWSGIDFMPLACELARKRCGPDVDVREASVAAIPFADGSFDAVVSADVICQLDECELAVRELARVTRPGGAVVVCVPAYMWMWSYHDDSCETKHRYTRREIAGLLEQAGLRVTLLTHLNALPFPLIWAKRKFFRSANDTSDMKEYPAIVNNGFRALTAVERVWLRAGGTLAWGSSVFAVARKP